MKTLAEELVDEYGGTNPNIDSSCRTPDGWRQAMGDAVNEALERAACHLINGTPPFENEVGRDFIRVMHFAAERIRALKSSPGLLQAATVPESANEDGFDGINLCAVGDKDVGRYCVECKAFIYEGHKSTCSAFAATR